MQPKQELSPRQAIQVLEKVAREHKGTAEEHDLLKASVISLFSLVVADEEANKPVKASEPKKNKKKK